MGHSLILFYGMIRGTELFTVMFEYITRNTMLKKMFCVALLLFFIQLGETRNLEVSQELTEYFQESDVCSVIKENDTPALEDLFLQSDTNPNQICDEIEKTTPLFLAIKMQNPMAVELLLSHNASADHISSKLNDNMIALQWAIQQTNDGDRKIFNMVLNATSVINHQDSFGNTSLHYLVRRRPSFSNAMVKRLYDLGAIDKPNNEKKTAYDTAKDLGYVQMAEFVSFYSKEDGAGYYGQFKKLVTKAYKDTSAIQSYVDTISTFPQFSYLATQEVKDLMNKFDTTENLEYHDDIIRIAKKHANEWNATIYPGIKSLYEEVGTFSTEFVYNYDNIESKIQSLNQSFLTDEEFKPLVEEKVQTYIEMKEMEGERVTPKQLANVKKYYTNSNKYRLVSASQRDNWYREIIVFLEHVYDYGIQHERKANKTISDLQRFKGYIENDRKNFLRLEEYTLNMTAMTNEEFDRNSEALGLANDAIEKYHKDVANASKTMEAFLTKQYNENKVVAELELSAEAFNGFGEISDSITDTLDDNGVFGKEGSKSSSSNVKYLGAGLKLVGTILNIAAMAKKLELAEADYQKNLEQIQNLDKSTKKYQEAFQMKMKLFKAVRTFQITKSTQEIILTHLEDLGEKVDAAINEVVEVQSIWNTVNLGIEKMKDKAEIARNRIVDDDDIANDDENQVISISENIEISKKYLFSELKKMYDHWNEMVNKPLPRLCTIFGCQSAFISMEEAEKIWNVSEPEKIEEAAKTLKAKVMLDIQANQTP